MSLRVLNPELISRKPQAVCLDLDDTLYDYKVANDAGEEAVVQKISHLADLERGEVADVLGQARALVKKQLGTQASSHSRLLYFQKALEFMGLKSQTLMSLDLEQTFWRNYLFHCRLHDGVRDFLFLLRSMDITSALITDLTAQIQFRKIIYLKLDNLVDYVVTSEEAGADKPDPAPFQLALDKIGCDPAKVWMIGDSLEKDILGAQALGLRGILKGRRTGVNGAAPWAEFDSFNDLVKLFRQDWSRPREKHG